MLIALGARRKLSPLSQHQILLIWRTAISGYVHLDPSIRRPTPSGWQAPPSYTQPSVADALLCCSIVLTERKAFMRFAWYRSRDSPAGIVARVRVGHSRNSASTPGRDKRFFACAHRLWGPLSLLWMGTGRGGHFFVRWGSWADRLTTTAIQCPS